MKLRKKGDRIYPVKNIALFKHCSGGFSSVTEREYPELEKILICHGVDFFNIIEEDDDG